MMIFQVCIMIMAVAAIMMITVTPSRTTVCQ